MAELIPAGVEAALVAFRTGLHSFKTQQDIEPAAAGASQPWSFITSLTESQAVETCEGFIKKAVSIMNITESNKNSPNSWC